jgi:Transposase DDE domain group 1
VQLACDLIAWAQTLALHDHPARRWEPKRLRLRLFSIAGRISRHARRTQLQLAARAPWVELITTGLTRLAAGTNLTTDNPTLPDERQPTRERGTRRHPTASGQHPYPMPPRGRQRPIRSRSD